MTESEALDMAARAAGWPNGWGEASRFAPNNLFNAIRAHAKTIMENAALKAENERLREALERIADRPGEGVEYFPGHGDEVISEARNMELIARAALKEIEGDWR